MSHIKNIKRSPAANRQPPGFERKSLSATPPSNNEASHDNRTGKPLGGFAHVPTADARILPKGTAYQTDSGMCGDYDSVIGFDARGPLERFLTKIPKAKMEPAAGEGTLCGLLVEIDEKTGLSIGCKALQYPKPLGF